MIGSKIKSANKHENMFHFLTFTLVYVGKMMTTHGWDFYTERLADVFRS